MSKDRITASAIVKITIEVQSFSSWGPDCTVDQVQRQAAAEVASMVRQALIKDQHRVSIVGKPEVQTIITRHAK